MTARHRPPDIPAFGPVGGAATFQRLVQSLQLFGLPHCTVNALLWIIAASVRINMASWANHVLAQLQQRDLKEKLPFVGVFSSCKFSSFVYPCFCIALIEFVCLPVSRLEEHFELRTQILDDVYSKRSEMLLTHCWLLISVSFNIILFIFLWFFVFKKWSWGGKQ